MSSSGIGASVSRLLGLSTLLPLLLTSTLSKAVDSDTLDKLIALQGEFELAQFADRNNINRPLTNSADLVIGEIQVTGSTITEPFTLPDSYIDFYGTPLARHAAEFSFLYDACQISFLSDAMDRQVQFQRNYISRSGRIILTVRATPQKCDKLSGKLKSRYTRELLRTSPTPADERRIAAEFKLGKPTQDNINATGLLHTRLKYANKLIEEDTFLSKKAVLAIWNRYQTYDMRQVSYKILCTQPRYLDYFSKGIEYRLSYQKEGSSEKQTFIESAVSCAYFHTSQAH